IGPGTGALTQHLVKRAEAVHAVEVDRELLARLRVDFEDTPNIFLHEGDILKTEVGDLVPEGKVLVVGNLPYHITSDLILWLIKHHDRVSRAVILMQKEVALRLTAEPGEREAGSLTLALNYRCEAERLLDVPPSCFRPIPKVQSSLVVLRFRDKPLVEPTDERFFFRVIRGAFGERRKTLANSLSGALKVPRAIVADSISAIGLDERIRGERLSLEQFCELANDLVVRMKTNSDQPSDGEA
ncbi:MAG: ribosomal RNA small subunit methyltransferase A, partial [Candidatus Eisenbacteria bacterium]|nr:ribosomal RNA small subunit methyltransferase A [Candidatus Eisenbacteria bacterium]